MTGRFAVATGISDIRPANDAADCGGTRYQVSLTIEVGDPRLLWDSAAARALSAPGMTATDVSDVLGPREDPSIADCIAMLAIPQGIGGCRFDEAHVVMIAVERRNAA